MCVGISAVCQERRREDCFPRHGRKTQFYHLFIKQGDSFRATAAGDKSNAPRWVYPWKRGGIRFANREVHLSKTGSNSGEGEGSFEGMGIHTPVLTQPYTHRLVLPHISSETSPPHRFCSLSPLNQQDEPQSEAEEFKSAA